LRRQGPGRAVRLARLQGDGPDGWLRHDILAEEIDVWPPAPVLVKRLEHDVFADFLRFKLVWSSADGTPLVLLFPNGLVVMLRNNQPECGADQERRTGFLQSDDDGVGVGGLDRIDFGKGWSAYGGIIGVHDPLIGILHVCSGKLRAVMPLDPAAE